MDKKAKKGYMFYHKEGNTFNFVRKEHIKQNDSH